MPKLIRVIKRILQCTPWCALATTAQANIGDSLLFSASISTSYDTNIFRLSKLNNAQASLGRDSAAETIRAATGSVTFTKDYGLQHVDLNLNAVRYDYQNFSYLGFTALNYSGGVRWSLTPRIRGNILATRRESLINFGDFQNVGVQSKRTEINTRADGLYELDGAWQLVAGVAHLDIQNTAPFIAQRAYEITSIDAGIRRTWASRSQATWRLRKSNGEYRSADNIANSSLPSGFNETENEFTASWTVTPKSVIDTRLSYIQRQYDDFGVRDYSGVVSRTNLQWGITANTSVLFSYAHELIDYQTSYSSYISSDRVAVAPSWQAMPKLILSFRQEYAHREFKGPIPGIPVTNRREDRQYTSRLSATWKPRDALEISAWVQSDKRDSSYTGFDYRSRSAGVLAQFTF